MKIRISDFKINHNILSNLRKVLRLFCLGLFCVGFSTAQLQAQTTIVALDSTYLHVTTVAEDLHVPWEIIWGPDDFIWMTERDGSVSRLNPETGDQQILLELSDCYEYSESGLLGMALHPDFDSSPYVYLVYNYNDGDNKEKLVRYTYTGDALEDEFLLLGEITCNSFSGNHSGSRLLILPDETLLMTTGDYYNDEVAQEIDELNGKVLRMNLDGTVPADNPITGSLVYSWGHRNAQGLVLADNGIIYSSEHGPNTNDEFNIIEPNRNYGWPQIEGYCDTGPESVFCEENNVKEPLLAWTPTIAVCGIDYYNHPAIPELAHTILQCNLKEPAFIGLHLDQSGESILDETSIIPEEFGRMRDVCVAPNGDIYVATSNQDGRGSWFGAFPQDGDDRILRVRNNSYEPPVGIGEDLTNALNEISLRPNPFKGQASLSFAADYIGGVLNVYDAEGKLLRTELIKENEIVFDQDDLAAGVYFVKVNKNGIGAQTIKVLILP